MKPVLYVDCAATILERRRWLNELAAQHRTEAENSMTGLTVGLVILGILLTFVGLLVMG